MQKDKLYMQMVLDMSKEIKKRSEVMRSKLQKATSKAVCKVLKTQCGSSGEPSSESIIRISDLQEFKELKLQQDMMQKGNVYTTDEELKKFTELLENLHKSLKKRGKQAITDLARARLQLSR